MSYKTSVGRITSATFVSNIPNQPMSKDTVIYEVIVADNYHSQVFKFVHRVPPAVHSDKISVPHGVHDPTDKGASS
jgi:hypothetical protein